VANIPVTTPIAPNIKGYKKIEIAAEIHPAISSKALFPAASTGLLCSYIEITHSIIGFYKKPMHSTNLQLPRSSFYS
jgi:hypothetical protein